VFGSLKTVKEKKQLVMKLENKSMGIQKITIDMKISLRIVYHPNNFITGYYSARICPSCRSQAMPHGLLHISEAMESYYIPFNFLIVIFHVTPIVPQK